MIQVGSKAEKVHDVLREQIRSGALKPGDRLRTVRDLAQACGTSVPTVQQAMKALESEGMIIRRQGDGNYVGSGETPMALEESVTLCMETGAHVWGEVTSALLNRLHEREFFVSVIDSSHAKAGAFLSRFTQARSEFMVIHGNASFPFQALTTAAFQPKSIIAAIDWDSNVRVPGLAKVLADYAAGVEQVADHLRELGHQHVLVVGTSTQIEMALGTMPGISPLAAAVLPALESRGMRWQTLSSHTDPNQASYTTLDAEELTTLLRQPDGPTAIMALRDFEANHAQRILRAQPDFTGSFAVTGFFDTPWSQAGDPAITSVDLRVAEVASEIVRLIFAKQEGATIAGQTVMVRPRLVVRDSSLLLSR